MRPICAEENRIREMKHTGMARTERNHLDLSLCEQASLRSPEKNLYCQESDITNSLKVYTPVKQVKILIFAITKTCQHRHQVYKTLNDKNKKEKPWNESSAEIPITSNICTLIKASEIKALISGTACFYLGRLPLLASKQLLQSLGQNPILL